MAIFANKKNEAESGPKVGVAMPAAAVPRPGRGAYGIAEAIQLLRTLPIDQNAELIVRVVRSTLESLNVHLPDIIEDATRKQQMVQERIAAMHVQVADLEKQLGGFRQEIAALEADAKETNSVKEMLQMAESSAGSVRSGPSRSETMTPPPPGQHPPPPPVGARPAVKRPELPGDAASHKE